MRLVLRLLALAASFSGAAGCGQQGPLVLPEQARPIERIDAPAGDAEQTDDERRDER